MTYPKTTHLMATLILRPAATVNFCWFLMLSSTILISPSLSITTSISNLIVHKVPLRRGDASPYCYAVSSASALQPHQNFLSTQIWPAARAAASFIEQNLPTKYSANHMTVCELGCGPGLPSLAAAAAGASKVIASDLEPLALELVDAAARDQNLDVETRIIDLCGNELPAADLYVMSDVFESGSVAKGAAQLLHKATSNVWVFCQSDRAQRDIFRDELRKMRGDDRLDWISVKEFDHSMRLCLFNVDESQVSYG